MKAKDTRRIAECIAVWSDHVGPNIHFTGNKEELVTSIKEAIDRGDPDIQPMVKAILAVVSAYYAAGNITMEVAARQLIEQVASSGSGKIFDMELEEGTRWSCVVRRVPPPASQVIKPGLPDLMLSDLKLPES